MKPVTLTMEVKRDVRHERYNVSQCRVSLSVELEPNEDLDVVRRELHDDVVYLIEEMVVREKYDYWESKERKTNDASKNTKKSNASNVHSEV